MRFTIQQLEEKSKNRPQGYKDDIVSRATKINEQVYEITDEQYKELCEKYRTPSFDKKVKNLIVALSKIPSNPKLRTAKEVEGNLNICKICPHFIPDTFTCGSCGCNLRFKPLLKIWKCPKNKW